MISWSCGVGEVITTPNFSDPRIIDFFLVPQKKIWFLKIDPFYKTFIPCKKAHTLVDARKSKIERQN